MKPVILTPASHGSRRYPHREQILAPGGKILVEIGLNQGIRVLSIFQKFGWQNVEVKKDLTGHDRVVLATL